MDGLSRGTTIDRMGDHANDAPATISSAIEQLTGYAHRQRQVLIVGPAAAILLGLLYLLVTPSQYTATATLLIDSSPLRVLQNQPQPLGDIPLDTLQVGSQVEILESDNVALAVIRKLKLTDDTEFVRPNTGLLSILHGATSPADNEQKALDEFANHRSVGRMERSYVLNISFTARTPLLAANVANAIADAYIDDQLEAKDQTRRRAGVWLQERINELRAQVTSADRAVLDFKEKNKIVDLGGANMTAGPGAQARLIGEQQLFELNTQLTTARGATSESRARLERIEQVRKMDVSEAAVADTLRNEVITRLRNQYLDLSAREANLSARYGHEHQAAANLRDQMAELRRNISAELGRIAASYQSDYEIAKAREENLDQELATLVSEGQVTNRDRLGLAELESHAKIYHTVYDSFLQRYMDAIQQQSFPITEARVISPAAPPSQKSKPNNTLVLLIAGTMGLIASIGIAGLREAIEGAFRTSRQVEQMLGVKCLSVIPLLNSPVLPAPAAGDAVVRRPLADTKAVPSWRNQPDGIALSPDAVSFTFADPTLRYVVDHPLSVFAEAIRAIKVAARFQGAIEDNKVIGITSALPNEGKSTVACNLASLMADASKRVILLDADLRNPTLARALTPEPAVGLMELLGGKVDLAKAVGHEPNTNLALLPLVLAEQVAHTDEILSSQALKHLIEQLRQHYDYIIVDLPPLAPVVDVHAALPIIDSLVFVVEWGSTRITTVERHLLGVPEIRDRLMGVVLNKANLRDMERFEQRGLYHDGYYANRGYSRATARPT
jgi:succinoglycan biosynthesis transport protein ExoP